MPRAAQVGLSLGKPPSFQIKYGWPIGVQPGTYTDEGVRGGFDRVLDNHGSGDIGGVVVP